MQSALELMQGTPKLLEFGTIRPWNQSHWIWGVGLPPGINKGINRPNRQPVLNQLAPRTPGGVFPHKNVPVRGACSSCVRCFASPWGAYFVVRNRVVFNTLYQLLIVVPCHFHPISNRLWALYWIDLGQSRARVSESDSALHWEQFDIQQPPVYSTQSDSKVTTPI